MRTRPPTSWSDLAGARVGVWGLGVEGRASLRKLRTIGAQAVAVDDRPPAGAVDGAPALATAAGGLEALAACDAVVKTPGLSRYRHDVVALEARGVPVLGGLGLWLAEADPERVVCVTGTKGKSTTASILGHLLRGLGERAAVGGNLGTPPYDPDAPQDVDRWVVEVSSYQATDVTRSPRVVVVTSLHPDHLDWHGDAETYYRDKLSLCSRPGAEVTVANGDDPRVRERRALLGPRVVWVHAGAAPPPPWVRELGLLGRHNVGNALVAGAVLEALAVDGADDPHRLVGAARGFEGLDSRLRVVRVAGGVDFVDDSLSTNVLPTIAAVDAFPGRAVALLAGGHDRGIDYAPLAAHLVARTAPTLLLAMPTTGARIAAAVRALLAAGARAGGIGAELDVVEPSDLDDAVGRGFAWARPRGGVVLLSPAAASFDRFRDYRDRARAFSQAAARCAAP